MLLCARDQRAHGYRFIVGLVLISFYAAAWTLLTPSLHSSLLHNLKLNDTHFMTCLRHVAFTTFLQVLSAA